ncbi:PREDICTED: coordinator of PRMT5 and differentiation stimulator [Gekko japonicus]|uniref:Coordinator of PRMT5 and differentiation stimulator n=1 Tax=Gekko japonicus TaxID=146911 RepID=A0ABM1L2K3_GEKJA|nr:PREDICTED: coordinator of PRMT5 and differentiation stimulator [Gekko japonicus]
MEATGQQDPPGDIPGQRTEVDASAATGQGEVVKRVTFNWKPRKEDGERLFSAAHLETRGSILTDVEDSLAEEDEIILEDIKDLDDEELENEAYNVPTDTAFPEKNPTSHYEAEDWDKELAEIEYNNSPYDSEDLIFHGKMQDWDPVALCSIKEEPLYDPSACHVAPMTLRHRKTTPVDGQFEDAVD